MPALPTTRPLVGLAAWALLCCCLSVASAQQIAVGDGIVSRFCAIERAGAEVWCWSDPLAPTVVLRASGHASARFVQLSAQLNDDFRVCAAFVNSTYVCNVGGLISGQQMQQFDLSPAAGAAFGCGVTMQGRVQCRGAVPGGLGPLPSGSNFVQVAMSSSLQVALASNGSAFTFGGGGGGGVVQLPGSSWSLLAPQNSAVFSTMQASTPAFAAGPASASLAVVQLAIPNRSPPLDWCALLSPLGTAACAANNALDAGQDTPPPGPFAQLAAGARTTCGVRSPTGAMVCWGAVPTVPQRFAFSRGISLAAGLAIGLDATGVARWIAAPAAGNALPVPGRFAQLALSPLSSLAGGLALVCGVVASPPSTATTGPLQCFGPGMPSYSPLNSSAPFRFVAFGACAASQDKSCLCAITSSDRLVCTPNCPPQLLQLPSADVYSLHIGSGSAACVLLNNGTAACRVVPACVKAGPLPPLRLASASAVSFEALSSAGDALCGITKSLPASASSSSSSAGKPGLMCFTRSSAGNWTVPGDFSALSAGSGLVCAVLRAVAGSAAAAGSVQCWNIDSSSPLVDCANSQRRVPSGVAFTNLAATGSDACAWQDNGGWRCWGDSGTVRELPLVVGGLAPRFSYRLGNTLRPCPLGTFSLGQGSISPLCSGLIRAGRLGNSTATTPDGSTACQPGLFCPAGSAAGLPCPAGRFGSGPGLTGPDCSGPCPPGFFCGPATVAAAPCAAGRFGNTSGAPTSACSAPCPRGFFCPSATVVPLPCGLFAYCPLAAKAPLAVDPGMLADGGDSASTNWRQKNCSAGSFCLGSLQRPCPMGQAGPRQGLSACVQCAAGGYADELGLSSCKPSPPGHYSAAGATKPEPCPAGAWSRGDVANCTACSAGYWCAQGSTSAQQFPCGASNVYCPAGSAQPVAPEVGKKAVGSDPSGYFNTGVADCAKKHYCVGGVQIPCPPGRSQRLGYQSTCTLCTIGRFTANSGQETCVPVSKGYYADIEGSVDDKPFPCAPGRFGDQTGNTNAQCNGGCQAGFWCPPGSTSARAMPCGGDQLFCPANSTAPRVAGRGHYAAGGTNLTHTHELPCTAKGSFCVGGILVLCSPGRFSNVSGSSDCGLCEAGRFSRAGAANCSVCPLGQAASAGSSTCVACAVGTLTRSTGSSACEPCPAGTWANATGVNAECFPCAAGRFASAAGSAGCDVCDEGSYQPRINATSCLDCPLGRYADLSGMALCQQCEPGTYTVSNTACGPCPSLTVAPHPGMFACVKCPANADTPDRKQCQCKSGLFMDADGTCKECPNGFGQSCRAPGATLQTLRVDEGYFALNSSVTASGNASATFVLSALQCPPRACPGGNQTCAANRKGYLCAECTEGHSEWDNHCAKCGPEQGGYAVMFLVASVMYLLLTHYLSQTSSGLGAVFFSFCQVALLTVGEQLDLLSWLQVFNFAPQNASGGRCFAEFNGYDKFFFAAFVPWLIALELAVVVFAHWLKHKWSQRNAPSAERIPFPSAPYQRTAISLFIYSYLPLASICARYLDCRTYGDKQLVASSLNVECWNASYEGGLVIALLSLVVDSLGAPLLVFWFLSRARGRIATHAPQDAEFRERWGPLFEAFKPSAFFWQVWQLSRRALYVVADVAFTGGSNLTPGSGQLRRARMLVLGLLSLLSYLAQTRVQPYIDDGDEAVNLAEQFALLCVLLLTIALSGNPDLGVTDPASDSTYVAWVNSCCALLVVVPCALLIAYLVFIRFRSMCGPKRYRRRFNSRGYAGSGGHGLLGAAGLGPLAGGGAAFGAGAGIGGTASGGSLGGGLGLGQGKGGGSGGGGGNKSSLLSRAGLRGRTGSVDSDGGDDDGEGLQEDYLMLPAGGIEQQQPYQLPHTQPHHHHGQQHQQQQQQQQLEYQPLAAAMRLGQQAGRI